MFGPGIRTRGCLSVLSILSLGFIGFFLAFFYLNFTLDFWSTRSFVLESILLGTTLGQFLPTLLGERVSSKLFVFSPILFLISVCLVVFYPSETQSFGILYYMYLSVLCLFFAFFTQKLASQFYFYPALNLFTYILVGACTSIVIQIILEKTQSGLFLWPLLLTPGFLILSSFDLGVLKKMAMIFYCVVSSLLLYHQDVKKIDLYAENSQLNKIQKLLLSNVAQKKSNSVLLLGEWSNVDKLLGENVEITQVRDPWNFVAHATQKFDLVIFPLDYKEKDSYLYTKEGIEFAFQLLNPLGELIYANQNPQLQNTIKLVLEKYGVEEIQEEYTFLSVIRPTKLKNTAKNSMAKGVSFVQSTNEDFAKKVPTIDWPFPFFKLEKYPAQSLLLFFLILGSLIFLFSRLADQSSGHDSLMNVLLGFIIMILDIKCLVQFDILFGMDLLVRLGVLFSLFIIMIISNWISSFLPKIDYASSYGIILILSGLLSFTFPPSTILTISIPFLRLIMGILICLTPICMMHILYALQLKEQKNPENLLGNKLFGMSLSYVFCQYFVRYFGYNYLSIVTAVMTVLIIMLSMVSKILLQTGRVERIFRT